MRVPACSVLFTCIFKILNFFFLLLLLFFVQEQQPTKKTTQKGTRNNDGSSSSSKKIERNGGLLLPRSIVTVQATMTCIALLKESNWRVKRVARLYHIRAPITIRPHSAALSWKVWPRDSCTTVSPAGRPGPNAIELHRHAVVVCALAWRVCLFL